MKQRRFVCLILAAALSLSLCSCGAKKPKPELTVESYTELSTVLKLPPVYVPGGSWTEADIPGALWVGAKSFTFPATYASLGSKFSIDPEAADTVRTDGGDLSAVLLFDGCACGTIDLTGCDSKEAYTTGIIAAISFKNMGRSETPSPSVFPVAFNGITIGSTAEQFKENLGIELTASGAEIKTLHHTIQFSGSPAEGVTAITLISTV